MPDKYVESLMGSYYRCIDKKTTKNYIDELDEKELPKYHQEKIKAFLQDSKCFINMCL
jgi:hypothetical protein